MADPRDGTVVIGVGSPLMGDDGLGLVALDRLRDFTFEPHVELLDGGTWGMNLLPFIESAGRLLILDAVRMDGSPEGVIRLEGGGIPRHLSTKLSPHQIDLREVMALAELRGTLPSEAVVLGLHPELVEMREGLSPRLEGALPELLDAVRAQLEAWGHGVRTSSAPPSPPPARTREASRPAQQR